MRSSLSWALGASVLLSGAALWLDQPPSWVKTVEPRLQEHQAAVTQVAAYDAGTAQATPWLAEALPATWAPRALTAAHRDLFNPDASRSAKTEAPIAPPPPPIINSPPAPPPMPAVRYRYLGRMTTPHDEQLIYLGQGEVAVAVKTGDRLEDGFIVDRIDADGVHLLYPAGAQRAVIPIPQTGL